MANDAVAKWLAFFLESFREFNPATTVKIIPYASDLDRVRKLCDVYECSLIDYNFDAIDTFATSYFTDRKKRGRLRKLAVFDADADTSVYIDIDTIVTAPFRFQSPSDTKLDIVYGTKSGDNVYNADLLPADLRAKSHFFSSGLLIISQPKAWTGVSEILEFIEKNRDEYMKIRAPFVIDQPLLNYYVDKTDRKVDLVSKVWPGISPHNWYNDPILTLTDRGVMDKYGRTVLFVHWAGEEKHSSSSNELRFNELHNRISARVQHRLGSMLDV
jgi:hypothetical protein